jgi:hypothetical protein
MEVAGRALLNTFIAGMSSAFVALLIRTYKMTFFYAHYSAAIFGTIAGIVSVSAGV